MSSGFDYAFIVNDVSSKDILDYRYFNVVISQVSRQWIPDPNNSSLRINKKVSTEYISYEKCGFNGLNTTDSESVKYIGINNYYCVPTKNTSIYGGYYSDQFRYIQIQVHKC